MMGGTVMAFLGGLHYWWPKMFGKLYSEGFAKLSCLLIFIGFNVTFFSQFIMGSKGMPRRYYSYLEQYQSYHIVSTLGSWVLAVGFFIMAGYLIHSLLKGKKSPANPWGGLTLEWTTPSPPPLENFEGVPTIKYGPYDYENIEIPYEEGTLK